MEQPERERALSLFRNGSVCFYFHRSGLPWTGYSGSEECHPLSSPITKRRLSNSKRDERLVANAEGNAL